MTFFSLIALAFGMMTAAADAAVPRRSFAAIAVQRGSRAARRAAHAVTAARTLPPARRETRLSFRLSPLRRVVAPLTGAATPRAPEPRR